MSKMKMLPEHFDELKMLIECIDTPDRRVMYEAFGITYDSTRYRWDCVWAVPREARTPLFDRIYAYADDTHIDTALKRIIK